jgi:MFS transporter, DHA2 family, multidrug resistance protein
MALLLALGPRVLPEYRDPDAGRLDLVSAAMSVAAVLAVIYGLKEIAQDGLGWVVVASILAGLTVGVGFVRRQRALAHPMIDIGLFRITSFTAARASRCPPPGWWRSWGSGPPAALPPWWLARSSSRWDWRPSSV